MSVMPQPLATIDRHANLPDVLQFMQVLWAVVHGLERTSKRMSLELGVSGPQRLVLRVAGLFPGLSAGDLATILHVHPSTLTGILQRLISQKLLHREDDPRDRRRAILRLTELGTRMNAVRQGTVESAVAAALADVSERDRAVAKRVLVRLSAQLSRGASDGRAPSRVQPIARLSGGGRNRQSR
jgi:DNA-binding MarR family transcriptional regulator